MVRQVRAVGAVATFTVAGIALVGFGSATPQPERGPVAGNAVAVAAAVSTRAKLYEFTTHYRQGYFYTASRKEADRAKRIHKFVPTKRNLGYVSTKRFKGALTLYRLRYKARVAYLVTLSVKERDSLVASGRFRYEGIVGYTSKTKGAGKFPLWRVSKAGHGWRAVNTTQANALRKQGWHLDGPLGYVWTRA